MKKILQIATIGLFLVALILVAVTSKNKEVALGSIASGESHFSTTTMPLAGAFTSPAQLKTGSGQLGQVIVQGSVAATSFYLVDATTTDTTKRNNVATSSILLASFGASPTLGTYTFDSTFQYGLILTVNGAAGTTTVTWK